MGAHYKGSQKADLQDYIRKEGEKVKIEPQALDIIWGSDNRYWRVPQTVGQPVELLQVCWLEVTGSCPMKMLEKKEYKVTFEVKTKPDAFGWSDSPVYLMAKLPEGNYIWKKADLSQLKDDKIHEIPFNPLKFSFTNDPKDDDKVSFGLYEIWRGRWKGGLVINKVIIEPAQ